MAQKEEELDWYSVSCSICLDLLKDPVTLSCKHKYCKSCIQKHWDTEAGKRIYSCPQCRQTFTSRPVIQWELKTSSLQAASEDVACDVCRERELKAIKSCPVCLISYCEEHLHLHPKYSSRSPLGSQGHKLVEPFMGFQNNRRAVFLRNLCEVTLDPNTAQKHLCVSLHYDTEKEIRASRTIQPMFCSSHPDRFITYPQVLSTQGLSGLCYCEVSCRGKAPSVAVSYKSISKSGQDSKFGYNDRSWSLLCDEDTYEFTHNSVTTKIPRSRPGLWIARVGVYLDHRAGTLSFYDLLDTMALIHRVQTTFTEPLHIGLGLPFQNSSAFLDLY